MFWSGRQALFLSILRAIKKYRFGKVPYVKATKPFIEFARKKDLFVCTNFMKSYALSPEAFTQVVKQSEEYGSQLVYLVDSAGGMLPRMTREYVQAMRSVTKLPIGFHGHNNLMQAVSNSLAAIESGACVVDTTLSGMGRSSGNAPTEILIPLMQRCFNACTDLNPVLFLELADKLITPFLKNRFESAERISLGLAEVHSMYADRIVACSHKDKKMLFSLIQEVGKRDKLNLSPEVLAAACQSALPENALFAEIGRLSLIENIGNDTSTQDILRVAIKLNIPIEVVIRTAGQPKRVPAYALDWP